MRIFLTSAQHNFADVTDFVHFDRFVRCIRQENEPERVSEALMIVFGQRSGNPPRIKPSFLATLRAAERLLLPPAVARSTRPEGPR